MTALAASGARPRPHRCFPTHNPTPRFCASDQGQGLVRRPPDSRRPSLRWAPGPGKRARHERRTPWRLVASRARERRSRKQRRHPRRSDAKGEARVALCVALLVPWPQLRPAFGVKARLDRALPPRLHTLGPPRCPEGDRRDRHDLRRHRREAHHLYAGQRLRASCAIRARRGNAKASSIRWQMAMPHSRTARGAGG